MNALTDTRTIANGVMIARNSFRKVEDENNLKICLTGDKVQGRFVT